MYRVTSLFFSAQINAYRHTRHLCCQSAQMHTGIPSIKKPGAIGIPRWHLNRVQAQQSPLLAVHPVPASATRPPMLRRPKRRGTAAARGRHRPRAAWRGHRVRAVCGNGCLAAMAGGVPAAVSSTATAARVARRHLPPGHRAGRSRRSSRRVGRRQRLRKDWDNIVPEQQRQ